jgi:hypothetical protein
VNGKTRKMVIPRNRWHLEYWACVGNQRGRTRMQCQDPLCPIHELHHLGAIQVLRRYRYGREAKRQLQP